MRGRDCPSDEAWASFPDAVSEAEHGILLTHLAACPACRTFVAELARQGAVVPRGHEQTSVASSGREGSRRNTGVSHHPIGNRLGRFVVIDVLGHGGLGTVLSAYDPQLDRRVALKVLRGGDFGSHDGRERMIREAQALAKIDHPNVVPIHEVAELDEGVVLVMEQVEGQTLGEWAKERPPWQDIVRTYVQAGHGLAAAHAVGLVHRDFKPSNAIIGADGRVRVIDFGLVRHEDAAQEPEDREDSSDATPIDPAVERAAAIVRAESSEKQSLTQTGTVLGTPAYMAPEQFQRTDVGTETDVYGFCVSLFEALYDARPFPPRKPGFQTGEGTEPPAESSVPGRVWAALRPGLSVDPGARPPIDRLLEELRSLIEPPRRKAWKWAVALAALAVPAGVLAASLVGGESEEPCSGGGARIAKVWNPAVESLIGQGLTDTLAVYAGEVVPRVQETLRGYASAWTTSYTDACQTHLRGEQSDAVLDKRMHCLERRRQALSSTVSLLKETAQDSNPIRLVLGLPSLASCEDLDALAAQEPLPESPAARARLRELEGLLEQGAALQRNGDYAAAGDVADAVRKDAETLGMARLEASANLQLGRARLLAGRLVEAEAPLRVAQRQAVFADVPEIAAEAIARRIFVQGVGGALGEERMAELQGLAEDFLLRTTDGSFERALLLNNVGVVFRNLGKRAKARETLEQALAAQGAVKRFDMELGVIIDNLAAVTDDPAERIRLLDRAALRSRSNLGAHHPETLRTLIVRATTMASPQDRHRELSSACDAVERFHPRLWSVLGSCALELGVAAEELGRKADARAHFDSAADRFSRANNELFGELARGQAARLAGNQADANAAFDNIDTRVATGPVRPWRVALQAIVNGARAELAAGTGDHTAAVRFGQTAVDALAQLDIAGQLQWQVALAHAELTTGYSLLALGKGNRRDQAVALLRNARRFYDEAGAGYEERVRDIDGRLAGAVIDK